MDKRIKKLWIKALRSGEFQQTRNALRAGSGKSVSYCCLGVLCELHRRHSKAPGTWKRDMYMQDAATLPVDVIAWAKLEDDNPNIPQRRDTLAGINDSGKDFNHIADVIEKYL